MGLKATAITSDVEPTDGTCLGAATGAIPLAQPPNTARLVNPISATVITRKVRVVPLSLFIVFSVKNRIRETVRASRRVLTQSFGNELEVVN